MTGPVPPDPVVQGRPTQADVAVRGRRIVTPEGVRPGVVLVRDGRIVAVAPHDTPTIGIPVVDAEGSYVVPGFVDSHVHFRTPGLTHKEDWPHASRAAAAGGVTTVADMPNTQPPTLDVDALAAKAELIAGTSVIDYVFHMGADPQRPELLSEIDRADARTAKLFLAGHHTAPTVFRDQGALEKAFAVAAETDLQLVLHAEDAAVFDLLDAWRGNPVGYLDYEARRPRTGGIVAVAKVIELVRRHGTRAHVLHVSSAEEVDLLCAAASVGLPVTFEVLGHHLSFTDTDTLRFGARTRLSPSIRGQADQDRLWEAVFAGEVATIGSDHAPHSKEEKTRSVADAPPGLPGVQELAVTVWTGMRRRRPAEDDDDAIRRLVQLLSTGPADLLGLPLKGRIAPGADADLVLFAPHPTSMFSANDVRSKCGWSAYEGWTLTGSVERTYLRGRLVHQQGRRPSSSADGMWLR